MPFPLFTYLPAAAVVEANNQRSARGGDRGRSGRGGGAYFERRATSSLRCAWRVSSTRSRMLALRSSFGADMATAAGELFRRAARAPARGRECGVVVLWRLATGELAKRGERCENGAEDTRLYTRQAGKRRGALSVDA